MAPTNGYCSLSPWAWSSFITSLGMQRFTISTQIHSVLFHNVYYPGSFSFAASRNLSSLFLPLSLSGFSFWCANTLVRLWMTNLN
jgi:hypothetical protein